MPNQRFGNEFLYEPPPAVVLFAVPTGKAGPGLGKGDERSRPPSDPPPGHRFARPALREAGGRFDVVETPSCPKGSPQLGTASLEYTSPAGGGDAELTQQPVQIVFAQTRVGVIDAAQRDALCHQ